MQIVFASALGLVVTDGTEAGTSIIKPAVSGPGGFDPVGRMANLGQDAVFVADAGGGPGPDGGLNNLWITDGTASGTSLVATLPDDTYYSDPPTEYSEANLTDPVSLGSLVVFAYTPLAPDDNELWSTDGTAAGTVMLPGIDSAVLDPGGLLSDGSLVFTDASGLDVTDGTAAGTEQLEAGSFGHGEYPFYLASLGSIVVFAVASTPADDDAVGGDQLWRTDGTPAGTVLVTDLPRYSNYTGITSFASLGNKALFTYQDGSTPFEPALWVTDGTAAGTFEITGVTDPTFGAVAGGRAILVSAEGLVSSDGTVAGTQVIKPKSLGPDGFGPTTVMASLGNDVVFAAAVPTSLNDPYVLGPEDQLWITDGTTGGTSLIETLPGSGDISSMTSLGDRVVFTYDGSVWTTDGTSAGTSLLLSNADATLAPGSIAEVVPPCFAAGTRIATTHGLVPVENLREGDIVLTASGGRQTIQWVGYRPVDCRHHPHPERVWPILIAVDAFGEGRPQQPLLLSPDHAVFDEDVLVPIKFLVNGDTIARIEADRITYYHIELPRHDIVLAEGLPTESYLETGGRKAFANGGVSVQLHADFAPDQDRVAFLWESLACAPLLVGGVQLERARAKLAVQAEMLRRSRSEPVGEVRTSAPARARAARRPRR